MDTEPTDEQLRHQLHQARQIARQRYGTSFLPEALPTFSVARSETCRRCGEPLPEDRFAICAECDVKVDQQIEANRERLETEDRERRLRQSGLPKIYADGTRKASSLPAVAQQALTACEMLGSTVSGLYLYGEAGTYKTSVAAAFLAERVRKGGTGRFVSVPDLFTDLYAIYASDDRRSRADLVDELVSTPRLVLDDLGKEKASDHAAGVVFEILDGRYRNAGPGRWMIVTSNLPIHTLAARFADDTGDPIARRLAELTVAVPMERGVS